MIHSRLGRLLPYILFVLIGIASPPEIAAQCFPQQNYTTPGTSDYFVHGSGNFVIHVRARGADGGPISTGVGTSRAGGSGAEVTGEFTVPAGTKLRSFVGQTESPKGSFTLQGGGGSAVVIADTSVMVVGGGGGGANNAPGQEGGGGQGITGAPAGGGAGALGDAGGGGFNAAGANATGAYSAYTGGGAGTLTTIGAGGLANGFMQGGGMGFGGGGSSGLGGAGGGGYKGGNGGGFNIAGQGGTSYLAAYGTLVQAVAGTKGGGTIRDGEVVISCQYATAVDLAGVSGDGQADFPAAAMKIDFTGVSGSGDVTVDYRVGVVADSSSIPKATVFPEHFVITADGTLAFTNAELRIQVNSLVSPSFPDPSTITLYQRSNPGSGAFTPVTTSYVAGTNEIVGTGISSFSEFALASDDVLPVELTTFDATVHGDRVALTWETSSETNNAGFEIQRQVRPGTFEAMTFVPGHGTTLESRKYSFETPELSVGSHVFRLKQIDFDGSFEYSELVEAVIEMPGSILFESPYPNPFAYTSTVRFGLLEKAHARITLFDVLGREVSVLFDGPTDAGQIRELQVFSNGLPDGTYLLRLEAGSFVETRSMTIAK